MEDSRLELFDGIAEAKENMDIAVIKEETDAIYDMLKSANNGKDDEMLKSHIYTAISSYYVIPELNLRGRIFVIKGMCFYSTLFVRNEKIMASKSIKEQIDYCLQQRKNILSYLKEDISIEEEKYYKLGIVIAADLNNKAKEL